MDEFHAGFVDGFAPAPSTCGHPGTVAGPRPCGSPLRGMVTRPARGGCARPTPRRYRPRVDRTSWASVAGRRVWPADVAGSRWWSGAGPRGGRRGPGRTSSPSLGTWPALRLPPRRDERAVGPAALEQQLVIHGQLADLGPQPGDLVIPVVGRSALQSGLAADQEVVAPVGEGRGGDAKFAGDEFQVFAPEQAEDGSGLALGGEAAALSGVRCVGHGFGSWV